MELESDEFVVRYDESRIGEHDILTACKDSGFAATIANESIQTSPQRQTEKEKDFTPPRFYAQALQTAKNEGKPIVLDFMATWCAPCKRISNETFVDKDVAPLLEKCILLKIDTDEHPELARHFEVSSLPDIRFLTQDGKQVKQLLNFQAAAPFANELNALLRMAK